MRKWIALVGVLTFAAAIWRLLPPPARLLSGDAAADAPPRGAVHVHTRRSDGSGTVDQIAAAAAAAGLRFVILTDHGDGLRSPESPSYRYGVLCIDGLEVSTTGGHVVALGLETRTPYRLGGDPGDVVEDLRRLGAMSIAAHPGSVKSELNWQDWDVPVDALEWMNVDSEWRNEPPASLARALLTYPFRKAETIAALFDRPDSILARWDTLTQQRPMIALAATDAHASMGIGRWSNPYGDRSPLAIPGYRQVFGALSMTLPELALSGDPYADARAVISEIRRGRLYSSIDAIATPARLTFTAVSATSTVVPGGTLHPSGPVSFVVRTNAPPGSRIHLLRNGTSVKSAAGDTLEHHGAAAPGAYRVEVQVPGAAGRPPVPWIVSNPIYVGPFDAPRRHQHPPATRAAVQYGNGPIASEWGVESSHHSQSVLDVVPTLEGSTLFWRFALGGSQADSPYTAIVRRADPGMGEYDRIVFSARASRPMRLWVQLRTRTPGGSADWKRSVYLDETMRQFVVPFAEMRAAVAGQETMEERPEVDSMLWVVDPVHTPLGTAGQVWLDDVKYVR